MLFNHLDSSVTATFMLINIHISLRFFFHSKYSNCIQFIKLQPGYYDMNYQTPTSLGAAGVRDANIGSVAYSTMSDGRFARTDNNSSPVSNVRGDQLTHVQRDVIIIENKTNHQCSSVPGSKYNVATDWFWWPNVESSIRVFLWGQHDAWQLPIRHAGIVSGKMSKRSQCIQSNPEHRHLQML